MGEEGSPLGVLFRGPSGVEFWVADWNSFGVDGEGLGWGGNGRVGADAGDDLNPS